MSDVIRFIAGEGIRRARRLRGRVEAVFGAAYRCPVCGSRVRSFRPLPQYYSDNLEKHGWPYEAHDSETCNRFGYTCPYCDANDRDRLYALYLQNYFAGVQNAQAISIVDFAPATSLSKFIRDYIARSVNNISYRTADAFVDGVDDRVDITQLKIYDDGQFDFFICSHVLEHVSDDRKALCELYRILKPGGKGILMVPIILSLTEIDEDPSIVDEAERWRRFGQYDHVRLYSKNGFIERMRYAGFRVHEYGKEFFGEETFITNGISSQSVLYVVEK